MKRIISMSAVLCILLVFSSAYAKTLMLEGKLNSSIAMSQNMEFSVNSGTVQSFVFKFALPAEFQTKSVSQTIDAQRLNIKPNPSSSNVETDKFGNRYQKVTWNNIDTDIRVSLHYTAYVQSTLSAMESRTPFPIGRVSAADAVYLKPTELVQSDNPDIAALAKRLTAGAQNEYEAVTAITNHVADIIKYTFNPPQYDAAYTLETKSGNCQNFAHLSIAMLRKVGIPARIVGGITLKDTWKVPIDNRNSIVQGMGQGGHAWMEIYFPDLGWLPYDPQQSRQFTSSRHIKQTHGLDSRDINDTWRGSPYLPQYTEQIDGVFKNDDIKLKVKSSGKDPRPYIISNMVALNTLSDEPDTAAEERERAKRDKERKEKEQAQQEKRRLERLETERQVKLKAEEERKAFEAAEKKRIAQEQIIQERLKKERLEAERLAKRKAEQERAALEAADKERLIKERREAERLVKLKAEEERKAAETAVRERLEREKAEADRVAKLKAEEERKAVEKAERDRVAREKIEKERIAKEKTEKERIAIIKAKELEQREKERIARLKTKEAEEAARIAALKLKPAKLKLGTPVLFGNMEFPNLVKNYNVKGDTGTRVLDKETSEYVTSKYIYSQAFTVKNEMDLHKVSLAMRKFGGDGSVYVDIVQDDGGKPGLPGKVDGVRSNFLDLEKVSRKPGYYWVDFSLPSKFTLKPGKYWIVFRYSGEAIMNWFYIPGKPYSDGDDTRSTAKGYEWEDILNYDFVFKVAGTAL